MRRFRRPGRGFRRMLKRGFRRGLRGGGPIARLRRAHQAMATGAFDQAEVTYLELSEAALDRGLPQGASLLVAAGMAAVQAGNVDRGLDHLLQGLEEFRGRGQMQRLTMVARRIIDGLTVRGHASAVERIESYLHDGGIELQAKPEPPTVRASLPAQCPHCGGSVRPDEVEWAGLGSAVCDYCGSTLLAESP